MVFLFTSVVRATPPLRPGEREIKPSEEIRAFAEKWSDYRLERPLNEAHGTEGLLLILQAMNEDGVAEERAFAGKLAAVLRRHGVELPAGLKDLKSPATSPGAWTDRQIIRLDRLTVALVTLAGESALPEGRKAGVSPAMARDLLLVVCQECPGAFGRELALEPWFRISACSEDGDENRPPMGRVAPEDFVRAAAASVEYVLFPPAEAHMKEHVRALYALSGPFVLPAVDAELEGRALLMQDPALEAMEKLVDEMEARLKKARAEGERAGFYVSDVRQAIDLVVQRLPKYRKSFATWGPSVRDHRQRVAMIRRFFDAVNREDRDDAMKELTAASAAALPEGRSMRSAITGASDVKEVRYVFCDGNPNEYGQTAVYIEQVDMKGRLLPRKLEMGMVKEQGRWRIGMKSSATAPTSAPSL